MCTLIHVCVYLYTHACVYTYTCVCVYIYTHAQAYICVYTCPPCAYAHILVHCVHLCACALSAQTHVQLFIHATYVLYMGTVHKCT